MKWIHSELSSKIVDDWTEEDKINTLLSPQNGITLDLSAQALFDSYAIAVDVDVSYIISHALAVWSILTVLVQG